MRQRGDMIGWLYAGKFRPISALSQPQGTIIIWSYPDVPRETLTAFFYKNTINNFLLLPLWLSQHTTSFAAENRYYGAPY